jgi:futalosine hydrolase
MEPKNILVVSATFEEIKEMIPATEFNVPGAGHIIQLNHSRHRLDLLITGPGMVPAAFHLGQWLGINPYDLVINAGIAGSFHKRFMIGDVVNVISDCFADLGAESADRFIPLYKMKMAEPYATDLIDENGIIKNTSYPVTPATEKLPSAKGITVNTISGEIQRIDTLKNRTDVDIETMEGAAFFYACRMSDTPCLQIRAISNYIEPRNLKNWDIPLAVMRLTETLGEILNEL